MNEQEQNLLLSYAHYKGCNHLSLDDYEVERFDCAVEFIHKQYMGYIDSIKIDPMDFLIWAICEKGGD